MKYQLPLYSFIAPIIFAIITWFVSYNLSVAIVVFIVLLLPAVIRVYVPYAHDNPNHVWFKRKLYGWGWVPVTWQGWVLTLLYTALVIAFGYTIDDTSPTSEVIFTFALPVVMLTVAFIKLCYKKGEHPHWSWGRGIDKK